MPKYDDVNTESNSIFRLEQQLLLLKSAIIAPAKRWKFQSYERILKGAIQQKSKQNDWRILIPQIFPPWQKHIVYFSRTEETSTAY